MVEHKKFIALAIARARIAVSNGGYPFGAIIVKDGNIVGQSNVEIQAFDPTAHAELSSIRDACQNLKTHDLTGCQVYSSCHPCQMCLGAIKWVGIKDIYYAMDKPDAHSIGLANDIFMDDAVNLNKHKIEDNSVLDFMKDWYKEHIY